jgi:thioredoxin 1
MERLKPSDFDGERLRRPGGWAVCFTADWCPFCRAFAPKFEAIGRGAAFQIAEGNLTEEENPLWETMHVDVVPTLVAYVDGNPVWRRDGTYGVGLHDPDLTELVAALTAAGSPKGRA